LRNTYRIGLLCAMHSLTNPYPNSMPNEHNLSMHRSARHRTDLPNHTVARGDHIDI
jgi:hypothetical protein